MPGFLQAAEQVYLVAEQVSLVAGLRTPGPECW